MSKHTFYPLETLRKEYERIEILSKANPTDEDFIDKSMELKSCIDWLEQKLESVEDAHHINKVSIDASHREEVLSDMMSKDEELGLYDGGEKERGITIITKTK